MNLQFLGKQCMDLTSSLSFHRLSDTMGVKLLKFTSPFLTEVMNWRETHYHQWPELFVTRLQGRALQWYNRIWNNVETHQRCIF